jgi:hypothetical protein
MVFNPAVSTAGYVLTALLLFVSQFLKRQNGKTKSTALTFFATQPDGSAMSSHYSFAQVEPQTCSADLSAVTMVTVKLRK